MSTGENTGLDAEQLHNALIHSIRHTHLELVKIAALLEANNEQLAVGGSSTDRTLENWPVAGLRRRSLTDRRVSGNDGLAIPAQATPATLVLDTLIGRIGGSIINSGAGACILYLAAPGRAQTGVGALWLAANGGAWDFRLGNAIWSGPVSAIAAAGTTLVVCQV